MSREHRTHHGGPPQAMAGSGRRLIRRPTRSRRPQSAPAARTTVGLYSSDEFFGSSSRSVRWSARRFSCLSSSASVCSAVVSGPVGGRCPPGSRSRNARNRLTHTSLTRPCGGTGCLENGQPRLPAKFPRVCFAGRRSRLRKGNRVGMPAGGPNDKATGGKRGYLSPQTVLARRQPVPR